MKLLREFTMARVGLGRAGNSLPTEDVLAFQLAHAQARDAVYTPLDTRLLDATLVHSAARNRDEYLRRPDLGRQLAPGTALASNPCDLAIVIADGLSAAAVHHHAVPLLEALELTAPVYLVEQGRVAIGDAIGHAIGARMVLVLIGERPGLSSPDSLGAYLTWDPRPGRTDAERNCISNIRTEGLSYSEAARQLRALIVAAAANQLTGVALKFSSTSLS